MCVCTRVIGSEDTDLCRRQWCARLCC